MRLFIGLEIGKAAREGLMVSLEALKKIARGNFALPGNMHITLQFLGVRKVQEIPAIRTAMYAAAEGLVKLTFRLSEPGRFVRGNESIFWYGIDGDVQPLQRLYKSLGQRLAENGISIEKTGFIPHITLGRRVITDIGIGEAFQNIRTKPVEFTATEMVLFESARLNNVLAYIPVLREPFHPA